MKFSINPTTEIKSVKLQYIEDEFSFNMGEIPQVENEWLLNKISLASYNNQVVHVSGFCGLSASMDSNICLPNYTKGILEIDHSFKKGHAYGINDSELPVYLNKSTGWVCIGNPLQLGIGVEFLTDCVAIISEEGEFISLWLKPSSLPTFV